LDEVVLVTGGDESRKMGWGFLTTTAGPPPSAKDDK
jgi:hypothetical protein